MGRFVALLLAIAGLGLAACAGNGEGLDQNGNPIGSSSGASASSSSGSSSGASSSSSGGATAAFQTIQDQIFTPICTECHAGAAAPEGQQLTDGQAYAMIVNVPSQEVPSLDRIKPGDPDNSYLVQKIMGTAAVGAQMPNGCPVTQPCLNAAQIDLIRQWVSAGAPPPAAASSENRCGSGEPMRMRVRSLRAWSLWLLFAVQALGAYAHAEPYLAVREGLGCPVCHVNPTGGGLRTTFGDVYAQTQMPQQQVDLGGRGLWLGNAADFLRVGGDLRDDFSWTDTPHEKKTTSFGLEELAAYGAAEILKDRLLLYVDELLAPGGATTREAYGLLWFDQHEFYIKAGKFYLPYGLRLQDDYAFIRQATGVNYETSDNGVELGFVQGPWSAQLAVTNGTAGGSTSSEGKEISSSIVYVQPGWRVGASYSDNGSNGGTHGERRMGGVFTGVRTGPIAWLAEADYIIDRTLAPNVNEYAGLLEANWAFLRGNNLKLTAEYFEPDTHVEHNQQNRFSAVWEYTPIQFLQTRVGLRKYDGIPQSNAQNVLEGFVELHGFF